jgi:hypothetical protein
MMRAVRLTMIALALVVGGFPVAAAAQTTPTPVPPPTPLPTQTAVPSVTPALATAQPTPTDVPLALPTPILPTPVTVQPFPTFVPSPVATRTPPLVPLEAGVTPVGQPTVASVPPTGGQLSLADGSVTVSAIADPARPPLTFVYQPVDARSLPAAQSGLSLGFGAFQLNAVTGDPPVVVPSLNVPADLVIKPGASDMALALDRIDRLHLGMWNGSSWVALPCAPDAATHTLLVCSTTQPGLVVPLIVLPTNPVLARLDYDVAGGRFYTQGNGFGGGGGLGYAIVDDGDAPMWSEFQRQGGVGRLGYPVTNRFLYGGVITQAFQNGALQWVPDLGQSVLLNVLDELHTHGSDGWLDAARQVPPAPADGQPSDPSILGAFPGMLAVYQADPDLYGLPVSVKDYGPFATARFQRSTLQIWEQDQPFAAAGTVIPGSAGDLARAAGLWPASAATPAGPPPS